MPAVIINFKFEYALAYNADRLMVFGKGDPGRKFVPV